MERKPSEDEGESAGDPAQTEIPKPIRNLVRLSCGLSMVTEMTVEGCHWLSRRGQSSSGGLALAGQTFKSQSGQGMVVQAVNPRETEAGGS